MKLGCFALKLGWEVGLVSLGTLAGVGSNGGLFWLWVKVEEAEAELELVGLL